ncbi:SET domain-containing protein-lysine N-methyltransferase [Dactylosporangium aurantiacum]|uniref:SET domain-containing protein-lysine N-methyltransferase n=1 Tax=Dactylosporangium aurantiacum TaxID=35754 RepID=A0A9Q9MFJ5_9ACTN|nr:SET domain-containing protein-lysine N-methyltransferase [Dactylosporangium aurantiacum]MDG6106944.1 SET domain-containing protein-lysine N-methyltransferase [Dactylosporangium aurantiacum]UWZ50696.1 SET domain-containing protein-lysine N-methyltransferase [Dactylosporangium aurantiacum]
MLHSALHPGFSRLHGAGIIALRDVPVGTAVWWPCPRCTVLPIGQQAATPPDVLSWLAEYGYRRADGGLIAPCRGAHLLNHSCDAAVLDVGLSVGIAVRDIARGEEVTCDYRAFRYEDPWTFACLCGTARCTGTVSATVGEPPPELTESWSARLVPAIAAAASVPQETTVLGGDIHGVTGWRPGHVG